MCATRTKAKKLILHLGHGKTGSTSIQRALRASRETLQHMGVLFPDPGRHDNHQLLFPHLTGALPDDPVQMASLAATPQIARKQAAELWDALRRQIAEERPETIILSCENQFRPFDPQALERLSWHIAEIAETCDVIAYLRAPAPFFASNVQQDVKKRPEFRWISATRCQDVLAPFQAHGPGPVRAYAFARSALLNGDVVDDFVSRCLPDLSAFSLQRGQGEENSSVSPEAMALLQEVFRDQIALPGRFSKDRKAFRKLLVQMDTKVAGATRPKLFTRVQTSMNARAGDLDWIDQSFGIRFDGVDGNEMPRKDAENAYSQLKDVAQICSVDANRKANLLKQSLAAAENQSGFLRRWLRL